MGHNTPTITRISERIAHAIANRSQLRAQIEARAAGNLTVFHNLMGGIVAKDIKDPVRKYVTDFPAWCPLYNF
jgi:hypothetical protein